MLSLLTLTLSVLATLIIPTECQNQVDPDILSRKVRELTEHSLKYVEMQEHLDSLRYTDQPLDGNPLLDMLASTLGRKFHDRIAVVKRLQQAVSTSYSGTTSSTTECCTFSSSLTEYDPRFKQKVASNRVCELISASASPSPTKLSSTFRDTCIQNLQNLPSVKWQYFGSEQGVTTSFPATTSTDCGDYDNRFRPWYVQANVPEPKQVVIVIDKSGSMRNLHNEVSLMSLAKQAAKTVIDTLNPHGQFAVLAFSNTPLTYPRSSTNDNCFSERFAVATPQNKKKVSDFVDTITAGGGTIYGAALNSAFNYLHKESLNGFDRVILFMSDGDPNDGDIDILNTLQTHNQRLNNSVVMMTFGVGNLDFDVLRRMATQTSGNGPDVTRGVFTQITDPGQLRNQMASYYQYFATSSQGVTEPIWTVPYLDAWGLGQMITASLPVYVNNNLVGVTAVDVTIEELFAESTYFKPNELSYSFVIDGKGIIINHPLFPYVDDHDSLFVSATAFERDLEFLPIFDSMKGGGSGSKTFTSTRVLAQGDSRKYGVRELQVVSTYYWKRIPNTKFSVCLVLAVNDTQSVLSSQGSLGPGSFLYHRLDLLPPKTPCYHLNSYCSMDQSSVMLASRAFSDPEYYLSRTFTRTDVLSIGNYMEGVGGNPQRIKEGIRDEAVATNQADVLWTSQNENSELQEQVVWRYVGTKNGLFRIFPGTQMPNNFDPTLRPWYEHALANRESNVITPPYNDAASGAVIITLSHVLFEGRLNRVHDPVTDEVVGVMGVDLLLPYFHTILHQLYPICGTSSKCLLIDKAGYVVVADEYVATPPGRTDQHLTELEPEISYKLIRDGVFQDVSCSNIEAGLLQRTYNISRTTTYSGNTRVSIGCISFHLIPIQETNTFLIIRSRDRTNSGCLVSFFGSCSCNKIANTCYSSWTSKYCECPCHGTNTDYFPCRNQYDFVRSSSPPCTPENPTLSSVTQNDADLTALQKCYNLAFEFLPNTTFEFEPTKTQNPDTTYTNHSYQSSGAIAGGVVAGIAFTFIIVLIVKRICQSNTANSSCVTRNAHENHQTIQESVSSTPPPTCPCHDNSQPLPNNPVNTSPPPVNVSHRQAPPPYHPTA